MVESLLVFWREGGEDGALGNILHGVVGYAAAPAALRLGAWAFFVGAGTALWLGGPARRLAASLLGGPRTGLA